MHRRRTVVVAAQDQQADPEDHLPRDDGQGEPGGQNAADDEADKGGDDVEPVGGRIEQFTQPAELVELAGQHSIGPVGHPCVHQHDESEHVRVRAEQQPQK